MRSTAVVTVSDSTSRGERADGSGPALVAVLETAGFAIHTQRVIEDDQPAIERCLRELARDVALIVTTGGTGFGPRDVTPEATRAVIDREAPGLAELMRAAGLKSTPLASLSRGVVGTIGDTLVVNVPGSPRGAVESLDALLPVLPHALDVLSGTTEHPD